MWKDLPADSRQSVCDTLTTYSGHDARAWFAGLVKLAHGKHLAAGSTTQTVANGKRKCDDSDVALPASKKPRLADHSTFSSDIGRASTIVAPPSPAMLSTAGRGRPTNPPANPASSTATLAVPFGQSISVKQETPASPRTKCNEDFTFGNRKTSGALPNKGPGTTPSNNPSAQNASFGRAPAASPTAPPQCNFGSAAVSTVYNPASTGVDSSTLKVPANSNVSSPMNVSQAPSSLRQNVNSGTPKKLKCIQCKAFYIETQNTAFECRRHTGMTSYFHVVCSCKGQL